MRPGKRPVLVIAGPTASGKSSSAVALSAHVSMEILSADARQIFRGLDIGTATPTPLELATVPHHCINTHDLLDTYSVSDFAVEVKAILNAIALDVLPVFVGGSGLYLRAAIDGLSEGTVEVNPEIRAALRKELEVFGRDAMFDKLKMVDPVAADKYSDKNPRRVLRALEYHQQTDLKFSDTWQNERRELDVDATFVAISWDRDKLYQRINERCEFMWTNGLFDETKRALDSGIDRYAQSLRTVGYKEVCEVLLDNVSNEEGLARFKMSSRRYAKRQMTWFRADDRFYWIPGSNDPEETSKLILEHISAISSVSRFVV